MSTKKLQILGSISQNIDIDDTLTIEGAAADAAAVGEALDIKANKADIPTTLPNPYALTINGESYDGSEAVTVDVFDGEDGLSIFYAAVTAGDATTINVDHSDVADNEREVITGSQLLTEDGKLFVVTTISVSGGSSGESSKAYVADLIVDLNGIATSKLSEHNQDTASHTDIREQISQLSSDKADKSGMTLGVHTDGFVYLFVNGIPQGNGLDIKADVIEGDVFGYVDENNVIVLNGSIPEGTYTVKYEMEDGSTVDIGDLVLDNTVYYSVTNSLTNCVSSNSDTQADEGGSYSATISANSGYKLSSVVVTMGGTDISASAVSGGTITIANVTGNIVITAVAETSEPVTTNIALTDGIRIGSDGGDRTLTGFCATEMVDLRSIPKPCTIHLTEAKWASDGTTTTVRYYVANASGTALANGATTVGANNYFTLIDNNSDYKDVTITVTSDDVGYIRFSGQWGGTGTTENPAAFENVKATLTYTPN